MYAELMDYVERYVLSKRLFKKRKESEEYHLKILNVLAVMAGTSLPKTLWNYTGYVNVAPEDRKEIHAKSEFYMLAILITYAKKSYLSWQKRQEAVVFPEGKLDSKGVSFFKSTSTESTTNFIYDEILRDQIFRPKDGKVSLKRIYKTVNDYQKKITRKISEGDMSYMKRSIKVKSRDAYSNPMRINAYKSTYVWNMLNDDKDRIELPATVTIAKVNLKSKKDAAVLEKWPKIYNRVIRLFENDPDIGDHEVEVERNGKRITRMVRGKGINSIAIPGELDEMPDWVLPIIDVDTMVNENMRLIEPIMTPLGFHAGKVSINGSTSRYYTNIVRI